MITSNVPSDTQPRKRIFISYKRTTQPDHGVATAVFQALSQQHAVFIDQTMLVGTPWAKRIEDELHQSDFLITFLSEQSVHSEMVHAEIETAYRLAKSQNGRPMILPVRLAYRDAFEYPLSAYLDEINWAFWIGPEDTPRLIDELLQAIAGNHVIKNPANQTPVLASVTPPALSAPFTSAQPLRLDAPEGTMNPDSQFYLARRDDQIALQEIARQGVTVTIKGPRQIGKSSLLMRMIDAAQKAGKAYVFLERVMNFKG